MHQHREMMTTQPGTCVKRERTRSRSTGQTTSHGLLPKSTWRGLGWQRGHRHRPHKKRPRSVPQDCSAGAHVGDGEGAVVLNLVVPEVQPRQACVLHLAQAAADDHRAVVAQHVPPQVQLLHASAAVKPAPSVSAPPRCGRGWATGRVTRALRPVYTACGAVRGRLLPPHVRPAF